MALLKQFGFELQLGILHIMLPVGISFYTFKAMSYCLDVYRGQIKLEHSFRDFAIYISFFPQIISGPIERAKTFLPQIQEKRKLSIEFLSKGGWLILWGVFQKVFIADNLTYIVGELFSEPAIRSCGSILLGLYAYSLQMYCDFSGYTDISIGIALLMGIKIQDNFRRPFFAVNIQDFWARWHISLTTWVRDYVFYPLSLKRVRGKLLNVYWCTLISFSIIGFWHGAAWTFVFWGLYHGLVLCIFYYLKSHSRHFKKFFPLNIIKVPQFFKIVFTFNVVCMGLLFFKAKDLPELMLLTKKSVF